MLRRGFLFEFDSPQGWDEIRDGGRLIYRAPDAELIVSGSVLQGDKSSRGLSMLKTQFRDDALAVIRKGAAHPDLKAIKELRIDSSASDLECWTVVSETHDSITLFAQAVVVADIGVLLVTLESAKSPEAFDAFLRFLRSVKPVAGN